MNSQLQVDSSNLHSYYFKVLDSIIANNPFDTSILCQKAIKFMENQTGIKASFDGNYFGKMLFTRKDLIVWKEWYNKNDKNNTK
jgi:hypothetical protein